MSAPELQRPIEALLFVAGEALSIPQLAKLLDAEESEVATALQQIEAEYGNRGIVVREVAGGYRFATSPLARDVVEAYLLPPARPRTNRRSGPQRRRRPPDAV
jgi:segregation and condensation protein B